MRLTISISMRGFAFSTVVEGETYEELVGKAKLKAAEIAKKTCKWPVNKIAEGKLKKMTAIEFGQEAVKAFNKEMHTCFVLPNSCEEFVTWAIARKFATLEGR